jgi:hypothetical protein
VIEEMLQKTKPNQYGIRSLVHAVVDSPIFLRTERKISVGETEFDM